MSKNVINNVINSNVLDSNVMEKSVNKESSFINSTLNLDDVIERKSYADLDVCQDNKEQFIYAVGDVVSVATTSTQGANTRHYTPSFASRQSHNEKERQRRSRMKFSCDMLRSLVPGVTEKTDKATVLEHTVQYLLHLQQCIRFKCDDYLPSNDCHQGNDHANNCNIQGDGQVNYHQHFKEKNLDPTPQGQFEPQSFEACQKVEECQMIEVHESQLITDDDGFQYMVIETPEPEQQQ